MGDSFSFEASYNRIRAICLESTAFEETHMQPSILINKLLNNENI